jgi:type I restriction enzyme M protein
LSSLSTTIKSIQDIMRKDDGVDGDAQRIGQLTWMLFLKIFDQREEEWEDDAADRGETYVSPIPEACRWRNWAKYLEDEEGKRQPQIPASELIDHVNGVVFRGLRSIDPDASPQAKVIRELFADTYNYMKSGTLMLGVIEKLDEAVNFHDFRSRRQLGDIYEKILNDLRSAGNAGEFYTPRALTEFMVDRVNPSLAKRETVMDPACGTGGFLTAAIEHLRHQLGRKASADDQGAIEKAIHGIEKKQLPHLLCVTNLLLHGIDVPSRIQHRNTLATGWNDWDRNARVDCIVTNPPFGGMEDEGVGADFPADVRTRETADMFLTLIVDRLLKDGGRCAVVLPDGTLFGEGVKAKVKKRLLEKCNLHTIVRLPNGVFNPYTGIKTNLLFFTKGKPTETIWYYEHPYPEGYKNYSKTRPLQIEEFEVEKAWWGTEENGFADREENEFAWPVDFKAKREAAEAKAKPHWDKAEALMNQAADVDLRVRDLRDDVKGLKDKGKRSKIEERMEALKAEAEGLRQQAKDAQAAGDRIYWPIYNLDIPNPNAPEAESHDPDELLETYQGLLADIEETRDQLRDQLAAALLHNTADGEQA